MARCAIICFLIVAITGTYSELVVDRHAAQASLDNSHKHEVEKLMGKQQNGTLEQPEDNPDLFDSYGDIDQTITESSGDDPGAGVKDIDGLDTADQEDDTELHKDYGSDNDSDDYDDDHDEAGKDSYDEVQGMMEDEVTGKPDMNMDKLDVGAASHSANATEL